MRVVGTAGHVDHGKSTLIAALTGVHPDRLKEEQEREMTIDLGFGWLTLPDGEEIGIVDVPGHRDFIENMLAGIGGIDAALLVIAADEGVMPQTREHLAILDLLQIPGGVIVLTKSDLTPDPGWLTLVERDVRAQTAGTVMDGAPLLAVSARTGAGLPQLIQTLSEMLQSRPGRPDLGRPRLPIDRVFTMSGFGTVVTGTLSDGSLATDDDIEILPAGHRGRIRGLQTHKKMEAAASPGSRTAVNVSGISITEIRRGDVLAHPGQYQATRRLDARFRSLKDISAHIAHSVEVKIHIGAGETMARVRILDRESIAPGEEAWVQLELREPIVAARGDRFIARRPSPGETLGGGTIVDPQPAGRHKREDAAVLRSLETVSQGQPADILLEAALALGAAPARDIVKRSGLEPAVARLALDELEERGQLISLEERTLSMESESPVVAAAYLRTLTERILGIATDYHRRHPLRRGIPREELKSRLGLAARVFNILSGRLIAEQVISERSGAIAVPNHLIQLEPAQRARADSLLKKFESNRFSPPGVKEAQAEVGEDVFVALTETGELVTVSADVAFRKVDYDSMVAQIAAEIGRAGSITLAQVRDLFGTSRKYAQALLEHLDTIGVTTREGDSRTLKR